MAAEAVPSARPIDEPEITWEVLLETAMAFGDEWRPSAVIQLVPHLQSELQAKVLEYGLAIEDEHGRGRVISALVPHLDVDQVEVVLETALRFRVRGNYLSTLVCLVPCLSPAGRDRAVRAVLAQIPSCGRYAGDELWGLAPHLSPGELEIALSQLELGTDLAERAPILALIAGVLTTAQLQSAVDAVAAEPDGNCRAVTLGQLAPHLNDDQLTAALALATHIEEPGPRCRALTGIAPHLPAAQRAAVVAAALSAAADADVAFLHLVLRDLAPLLNADQAAAALDIIRGHGDDIAAGYLVSKLAPYLSPAHRHAALSVGRSFDEADAQVIAEIAALPLLSVTERAETHDRIMAIMASLRPHERVSAIEGLIPYLDGDPLERALTLLLGIEGCEWAYVLPAITPQLPPVLRQRLLDHCLRLRDPATQHAALAQLIPHLTDESQRAAARTAALAAARSIADVGERITALTGLVQLLLQPQATRAISEAFRLLPGIDDELRRLVAFDQLVTSYVESS